MPAKRKYNIRGTNDFLVLGAIFFFLGIWAIKDGWFPSPKVLKKHPMQVEMSFDINGAVEKVMVEEGDSVGENQLIAKLRSDKAVVEYEDAKTAYAQAKKKHVMMEVAEKNARENGASDEGILERQESLATAAAAMDEALARVTDLKARIDFSELEAPSKGKIQEIKIAAHSMVKAGEVVAVIDPKDHFYLFNKSLAIFSFLAFGVFMAIHILAR